MRRKQTSPTEAERRAVTVAAPPEQSVGDDLAAIRRAFGSWQDEGGAGSNYVNQLRSGARMQHCSPH